MKKLLLIILSISSLLVLLDSCMQFRLSKTEIAERFAMKNSNGIQSEYKVGKRTIHYAKTGLSDGPVVLFIHGSPGSLSDFIQFLTDSTLQTKAQLISVDRPGFGQSNFGWGEPSLEQQSQLIRPLIDQYKKDNRLILVGHSLGGPLIAKMYIDYPDLVDGLIFVAGSVDPELEPPNWWRAPFATPFFRWMMPRSIRASNDEIYPLKNQLKDLSTQWSLIQAKTIIIHGTNDSLVPFGNATFIERKLQNLSPQTVYETGMDHFVPWSHPHLIKEAVLRMINQVE